MTANRNDVDTMVTDYLRVNTNLSLPAGSLTNAMVSATAAIAASKLVSYQKMIYASYGTLTTRTVVLGIMRGATGLSVGVECSNVTQCAGSSTVTVDIQKDGVTILSSVVTLDSSTGDLGVEAGTITDTALADGEVITAVITAVASGTDVIATGVAVQLDFTETYPA